MRATINCVPSECRHVGGYREGTMRRLRTIGCLIAFTLDLLERRSLLRRRARSPASGCSITPLPGSPSGKACVNSATGKVRTST